MKCIIAIDDKDGMTFNKRRQSQDMKLREHILALSNGEKLWMNSYSFRQFSEHENANIHVDEDFLAKAKDDFCFVETCPLTPYLNKITMLYLCRWNRDYPSDFKLDLDLSTGWHMISSVDITGKSHEKITIEGWIKE